MSSSTVNWLVIGVGDITRKRVIPAILAEPRGTLYGLVTRDLAKAAQYPQAKAWDNLADALRDPAIDAVYVASPVALHHQQTVASLTAGFDVLCEKPVGMNYGEALSMAEVSEAAGKLLGVAYFRRLFPKLIRTKQLILDGAIGRPVQIQTSFHGWLESEERGWLRDPALAGGGPLYDTASHRIDACNYLFGTPEFATGIRSNPIHQFGVDEAATVTILYPGGVHSIIDVRWNSRLRRDECRVVGTEGEIDLTPFAGPSLRLTTTHGTTEEHLPANPNVHYPMIQNFVSAKRDGTPLAAPIREAIKTDWVTQQVMQASPALDVSEMR